MLDVFSPDAFSFRKLTDAINKVLFVPGRVSGLNLFQESSLTDTKIAIEERDGVLTLIAPTPRGGPGHTAPRAARRLRPFLIPHFQKDDAVMAEEVQGIRAFGDETQLETVQGKIMERMGEATNDFAATQELARVGAVKGIITYADGVTLNLFEEFDVTPPTAVDLNLDAASPAAGILRSQISGIARTIGTELSGAPSSGLYAICGNAFFDALTAHAEVRATYLNWNAAVDLRSAVVNSPAASGSWNVFPFGGVFWDNYYGAVGGTDYVGTNDAYIFPLGVPNLFRTYYAPADYNETVNTVARRLYAKEISREDDKGTMLQFQMNNLELCTRPGVLIHATMT